jgi:SAM-dependent methyltransferase
MVESIRSGGPDSFLFTAACTCRGCGSSSERELFPVDARFSVADCERCGLVATRPALSAEEMAGYYPAIYYGRRNRRFNPFFERLIPWFRDRRARSIERYVRSGRILDVGCGRGFLPAIMREHGWDAYGVELSPTAADHATRELGIPMFVGDFLDSPYPTGSFDVLVFWHVLEHLEDPVSCLRKAREILRPGGLLLVAVPNFESLQARFSRRHWFHLDVPRHYHHFRLSVLRRMLEENGFSVADVRHFNLEQNPYGWIQSLLNRIGFRNDFLYDLLKNRSARATGHPVREHPIQFLATLLALIFVVPVSFALFLVEAMIRRGGTVEIYARPRKPASGETAR